MRTKAPSRGLTFLAAALTAWGLAAAAPPVSSQIGELIGDFEALGLDFEGSRPRHLTRIGNKVVFFADSRTAGREPWVTEGTPETTRMLADSCPGRCGFHRVFATLPGRVFWLVPRSPSSFSSSDASLWSTDGTPGGSHRLIEGAGLELDSEFVKPQEWAALDGAILFATEADEAGRELWRSDGTPAGTFRVADLTPGSTDTTFSWFTEHRGKVLFLVGRRSATRLFETDGTEGGTRELSTGDTPGIFELSGFRTLGPHVLFSRFLDGRSRLWRLDPATGEAVDLTRDLDVSSGRLLKVVGSHLYFLGTDPQGTQLWRTDGTAAGTHRVSNVPSGDVDGEFDESIRVEQIGSRILFTAWNESSRSEIWQSEGPEATTRRFPDSCEGSGGCADTTGPWLKTNQRLFVPASAPGLREIFILEAGGGPPTTFASLCPDRCPTAMIRPQVLGDEVFFAAATGAQDRPQVWSTDGTAANTRQVSSIPESEAADGSPSTGWISRLPGGWVFAFATEDYGTEPWFAAASGERAFLLRNINQSAEGSFPSLLAATRDGIVAKLGRSNVTTAPVIGSLGTRSSTGYLFPGADPVLIRDLDSAAGRAYFLSSGGLDTTGLWTSDGTPEGTQKVGELAGSIRNFPFGSRRIAAVGGEAFFLVGEGEDLGLWRSDGTPAGTGPVLTLDSEAYRLARGLATDGESLFFVSQDVEGDRALWISGGESSNTLPIFEPARDSGRFLDFQSTARLGGFTYFLACLDQDFQLWRTLGAPGTTQAVTDLPFASFDSCSSSWPDLLVWNDKLYFFAQDHGIRQGLWTSDGTEVGTSALRRGFLDEFVLPELVATEDHLFFTLDDGVHGLELWRSDGSEGGTVLVRDLYSGPLASRPRFLTPVGDLVYFAAGDTSHGNELWVTDGTAEGTRLVHDLHPGPQASDPMELTASGSHLFFSADDGLSGRELWVLPLDGAGPPCRASEQALCLQGGRFKVEVQWRDFQGRLGNGQAVPLTADTGYFWFFSEDNVEAILKVLDGRTNNGHFWSFYGALSNVEYNITVTDAETGLTRRYFNPSRNFASVGDTRSFGPLGANATFSPEPATAAGVLAGGLEIGAGPLPPTLESQGAPVETCTPSSRRLCLNGGRFAVEATWADFSGNAGDGTAISLTDDTGYFWFFRDSNVETVLKVLDGRANNGNFWVFYGSLSNVDFDLTVTDTATGRVKTYQNRGRTFASVGDTEAFAGE